MFLLPPFQVDLMHVKGGKVIAKANISIRKIRNSNSPETTVLGTGHFLCCSPKLL